MRRMAAVAAVIFCAGCATVAQKTSEAPNVLWTPPASGQMPAREAAPPAQVPEEYLKPGTTLSLGQLVDVALKNNPSTREAWHFARAAAAEVGSKQSLYFPYIEVDGSILRQKQAAVNGQFTFLQTTYGPSVAASWLLFNFGGREADVQEATRALYAADWTHNAAIQDVVLRVAQAYYQYLNAKAQVVARQVNLEEAKNNLDAAVARHQAGIATIADELQARTAASQVELDLLDAQGQVQIIRGALATAVGVSANVAVEVGDLPQDLPLDAVGKSVEELIAAALARRPDLAAERFRVLAAQSHIHAAAIDGLPSLSLDANGNRT
ncbi:MAG: TolC family protein, partial [Acidobacteriota bacterium]